MAIKTYAARGLLEYLLPVACEGARLRLHFEGGSMGTNGILPGKYSTSNRALQMIIEGSPPFKSGKIYLYSDLRESH